MSFITLHGMMHQVYYTHLQEEYTETYTRFYNGETGSLAHCTYNSEWNILLSFLGSRLFSVLYFHLLFLLSIGLFFFFFTHLHHSIHPISTSVCPPQKLHGSQKISLFFVFDVISFYKHNMYRNSTQTNMFFIFFFISEYNFFFIIF